MCREAVAALASLSLHSSRSATRPALTPGTHLGDFTILERLGAGGMGEVYRALDQKLGREVALKRLLLVSRAEIDRATSEAQSAAKLAHPNLVSLFGVFEDPQLCEPWLVFEYVAGETLAQRVTRGAYELGPAIDVLSAVASGLAAAHAAGLVHCDLKPQNIMCQRDRRIRVLDFGLAQAIDNQTRRAGTAGWMSPEQLQSHGAVTPAIDVWAFGCLIAFVTTGVGAPKSLEAVPRPLRAMCRACWQGSGEQRPTMHELVRQLDDLARERAQQALDFQRRGRRFALAIGLFCVLLALTGVTLVIFRAQRDAALRAEAEALRESAAAAYAQGDLLQARKQAAKAFNALDTPQGRWLFETLAHEPILWARRFDGMLSCARWSPDEQRLALCEGSNVHLIDASTGDTVKLGKGHLDPVFSFAFSPNGKLAASGDYAGKIVLWDAQRLEEMRSAKAFEATVWKLQFLDGGRRLLAAGRGGLKLYDVNLDLVDHLEVESVVAAVSVSPDEDTVAFATRDGRIGLWHRTTQTVEWRHTSAPTLHSVALSRDLRRLVAGGTDGFVYEWALPELNSSKRRLHQATVNDLQFLSDGTLISSGQDGVVQLVSAGGLSTLETTGAVWQSEVSPSGRFLAVPTTARHLTVYQLAEAQRHPVADAHRADILSLRFVGTTLISGGIGGELRSWDGPSAAPLPGAAATIWSVAGNGDWIAAASEDQRVHLWNRTTHARRELAGLKGTLYGVDFTPDGRRLVSAGGGEVRLWDLEHDQSPVSPLDADAQGAYRVRITHDGQLAAVLFARGVRAYNLAGRSDVRRLELAEGPRSIDFAPKSKIATIGCSDGTIVFWNPDTGDAPRIHLEHPVESLAWSPDGSRMAVLSPRGALGLYSASGTLEKTLALPTGASTAVVWAPDGLSLAIAQGTAVVRWDIARDRPLFEPRAAAARQWFCSGAPTTVCAGPGDHVLRSTEAGALEYCAPGAPPKVLSAGLGGPPTLVLSTEQFLLVGASDGQYAAFLTAPPFLLATGKLNGPLANLSPTPDGFEFWSALGDARSLEFPRLGWASGRLEAALTQQPMLQRPTEGF